MWLSERICKPVGCSCHPFHCWIVCSNMVQCFYAAIWHRTANESQVITCAPQHPLPTEHVTVQPKGLRTTRMLCSLARPCSALSPTDPRSPKRPTSDHHLVSKRHVDRGPANWPTPFERENFLLSAAALRSWRHWQTLAESLKQEYHTHTQTT